MYDFKFSGSLVSFTTAVLLIGWMDHGTAWRYDEVRNRLVFLFILVYYCDTRPDIKASYSLALLVSVSKKKDAFISK